MESIPDETTFFREQLGETKEPKNFPSSDISMKMDLVQDNPMLTLDETQRILPVSTYSAEFVDPDKFPTVFGKPLEQRVWIIVAKIINNVTRYNIKNLRKRMESILDCTKYYDPYCKIRKSSVRVYLDPNYMHVVLDTIMNRKMRNDIFGCFCEMKEIRPVFVVLSELDQTDVYKVPDGMKNPASIVRTIVMRRYSDRLKYRVPSKMYTEFPTISLLPAIKITASGDYVYKSNNSSK